MMENGLTEFLEIGRKLLGEENVVNLNTPAMGGEDFMFFERKQTRYS